MNFSVALLAGGRSSRMARDKAFIDWHGRPLWRAQLEKLVALDPARLFVAARAEQNFAAHISREPMEAAITIVSDPAGEDCGPIGAITRCLRMSSGPLLVLAVDMPLMSVAFLRDRLLAGATPEKGAVCRGPRGYEALAAVHAPTALPLFEAALAGGRFSLQPLIAEIAEEGLCSVLEWRDEDGACFANANTPDDAKRLLGFQI